MNLIDTMILEVDIDGDDYHVEMMDGSTWLVNPGDLPIVATWLPTSEVEIEDTSDGTMFRVKITNREGTSIRAMRVS